MTIKQCSVCKIDFEYNPKTRHAKCHECHLKRRREIMHSKKPDLAENTKLDAEGKRKCRRCNTIKNKPDFRNNRRVCNECERIGYREYIKSDRKIESNVKFIATVKGDIEPLKEFYKERNVEIPDTITPEDISKLPEVNSKNKRVYRKKEPKSNRKVMTPRTRKLVKACRTRLKRFFKTKFYKTLNCIGCDSEFLKKWLEFNLTDDMTLSNHGDLWHIDHVLPISLFDLTIDKEKTICFHWSNLAPLHRIQNMAKGNRIDMEQLKNHIESLKKFIIKENISLESKYFDLFAKHLDAGTPLEL